MKNSSSSLFGQPTDALMNPVPVLHPTSSQKVDGTSFSAKTTSAYSAEKNTIIRIFILSGTLDYVWVKIGINPTAITDTSMPIQVSSGEYFNVLAGEQVAILGGIAIITLMD